MLLGEEKIKNEFEKESDDVAVTHRREVFVEKKSDSGEPQGHAEMQKLTREVAVLKKALEMAESAYLEAKNRHDGVFRQFKSLFVDISLGEAQKEQDALKAKLNEAAGAYREKLALLETGMEEVDKFDPAVKEAAVEAVIEAPEAKIKKTRVRKAKKAETAEKIEQDHFAIFQKHIAKGKAVAAVKVFRKALAKDVNWKEIKKLTLGQAVVKLYWHEDAQIKAFLHQLKEMLGDKGASIAGETLHEWTERISNLALEQASDEQETI